MTIITTYLYPKIITVHFYEPTIYKVRYNKVYAEPVVIHQGIDNPILVRVRNQDQKPVDMTGRVVQVDIQNPVSRLTEYSMGMTFDDAAKGYGRFTITREQADTLTLRTYKLTFRYIDLETNAEQPLYVDHNFEVPLGLIVKPAYYSDMIPQEGETGDVLNINSGTTP
jgi:hypothetical protein